MNLSLFINKYLIVGSVIFASITANYSQCCTYTLDMQDSFGDGWNGASVDILVNGASQGNFSVPANGSTAQGTVTICDGDSVKLIFNTGSWDSEISYTFSTPTGVIFSDGPSPFIGIAYANIGNCAGGSGGGVTYCNAGPSSNIDSNIESFFLLGNTTQINYTGCPGVLGVENMTTLNADVSVGSNYTATVQFGTCGGNYAGAGEAWIDWNQDGIYDVSESIGTWSGTPPTAVSNFLFIVPGNAVNGTTFMRVTQQEAGALPLDPCASFSWGSVVEFSIVISGGIDCSGYVGNSSQDPIIVPSISYIDTNNTTFCYSNQSLVYNSPDVFYEFAVNPNAASTTVSLCGSSFDTYLTILDSNLNVVAFNDDGASCTAGESEITFATAGYDTLFAVVEGWDIERGEFIISITENFDVGIITEPLLNIKMFPNPTKNTLYFSGNIISHVKIIDIQGRIVLNTKNLQGIIEINVSEINSGSYIVKLQTNNGNWLTKQLILIN